MLLISKLKLNTVEFLISMILINSNFGHDEFVSLRDLNTLKNLTT